MKKHKKLNELQKKEELKKKLEEAKAKAKAKAEADPNSPENYFKRLHENGEKFLQNIKTNMKELEEMLEKYGDHWNYEDVIYRFYHQSFKVYWIQNATMEMVEMLKKLAPEGVTMNSFFEEILKEGTGKTFKMQHNKNWLKHTRPMVEAFFHAKYFLAMAVKYGKKLDEAPTCLPSGWAGLLYLFNLR